MCDHEHYTELKEQVTVIDKRLTVVETEVKDIRGDIKTGFDKVEKHLQNIYAEKAKWGEFSRESLKAIGKWCAKWGGVILLAAIGLGNAPNIIKLLQTKAG